MNKLITIRQFKIDAYNSLHDLSPLLFIQRYKKGEPFSLQTHDIRYNRDGSPNKKDLVRQVLLQSQNYCSFNPETGKIETDIEKNRSVIDIWRHIKAVYPGISIFAVMKVLHSLCIDGEVFGQYCHRIKRAVFRSFDLKTTDMRFVCQEYKISFNTWRNLE